MIKKSGITATIGLLSTCLMVMATLMALPMTGLRELGLVSLVIGIPLMSYGASIFLAAFDKSSRSLTHAVWVVLLGCLFGVMGISFALCSVSFMAGVAFAVSSLIMTVLSWFYRNV